MRRIVPIAAVVALTCLAAWNQRARAASADQAVLDADHAFAQAIAGHASTDLRGLLDVDFSWTDSAGNTEDRATVLKQIPTPAIADEGGAETKERTYGDVGVVTVNQGKVYALRVWVKRPAGWRVLLYHEVTQMQNPPKGGGTGVSNCQNPCKMIPYKAKNADEAAIIASWQALETGVTGHSSEAWRPHIAEEFVQVSSNNDHPLNKDARAAVLDRQKQSGEPSAPAPLVSARMYDFGDAVVMKAEHQPYKGKPIHVSRVWVKRDGQWVMAISYQTTVQTAPSKGA